MENKDKLVTAEGLKAVYDSLKSSSSDVTVTTTGSGNAITAILKSGNTITATKDGNFAASYHTHSPSDFSSGLLNSNIYITAHPEDSYGSIIPFINNDIAFLTQRGGTISAYTTTDTDYTAQTLTEATNYNSASLERITDGCPQYCVFWLSSQTDTLIIDMKVPLTLLWNSKFYIDFGSWQWGATSISLYLWNDDSTNALQTYRLIRSATNQYRCWYTQSDYTWYTDEEKTTAGGYGFNRMRWVLTNWATTSGYRIAQIGVLNYGSLSQRMTTMSRGIDDEIWRNITPAYGNTYNLGSSTNRWSNVYAINVYGDAPTPDGTNTAQIANVEYVNSTITNNLNTIAQDVYNLLMTGEW